MRVGDRVRLVTPDNSRLDGTYATVVTMTEWGAHLSAPAAALGQYRALWCEMTMDIMISTKASAQTEYTGDCCQNCGSVRLKWAGACKVCEDCGESGGCG